MENTELKSVNTELILTKKEIQNILAFMERSQLAGKEAFVYVQLVTKLMSMLNAPSKEPPMKEGE